MSDRHQRVAGERARRQGRRRVGFRHPTAPTPGGGRSRRLAAATSDHPTLIGGIPWQPHVHTLPRHLEPTRHLTHRGAVQHLPDRPQLLLSPAPLKHHPLLLQSITTTEEPTNQAAQQPEARRKSVKHLPERLSRRNRNRVPKLSSWSRNPMVKHEPELHSMEPRVTGCTT